MRKLKRCSKCKSNKKLREFHKNKSSKDGFHHYCKICKNGCRRLKYTTDLLYRSKLIHKTKIKKYNLNNMELKTLFETYKSCCICSNYFESDRKTFIDHDHVTGKVRGLLCPSCNTALGLFKDNISILKSAITYLESR